MIKKYRFRTSLGEVVISFDEDTLKQRKYRFGWSEEIRKIPLLSSDEIKIDSGESEINNLYDCGYGYIVKRMQDGSLWLEVNLPNGGAYGSPEYLLEEVAE